MNLTRRGVSHRAGLIRQAPKHQFPAKKTKVHAVSAMITAKFQWHFFYCLILQLEIYGRHELCSTTIMECLPNILNDPYIVNLGGRDDPQMKKSRENPEKIIHCLFPLTLDTLKGISICFSMLRAALCGNYVNFGVFRLYGDDALDNALGMFVKLLLSISQSDLLVSLTSFAMLRVILFFSRASDFFSRLVGGSDPRSKKWLVIF